MTPQQMRRNRAHMLMQMATSFASTKSGSSSSTTPTTARLLEDGSYRLLEDGTYRLQE